MGDERQTRRQFCARPCSAAALAAFGGTLAGALQGCRGGGSPTSPGGGGGATALPTVNGNVSGRTVMLAIDAASPLAATGSSALVRSPLGDFLCPCHGSRFDTGGRVLSGPAQTALQQYPTQFAGNVLTITA